MNKKTKNELNFYTMQGFNLEDENEEYYYLTKNGVGFIHHLIIFVLFGWWLLLIPNVLAHLLCKKRRKVYK